MTGRKGADCGGIKTLEDLRQRCVIDEEAGCWLYGKRNKSDAMFWIPALQRHVTSGQALCFLSTGKTLQKGKVWRRICGCDKCINPKHRKEMTRAENTAENNKLHTPAMRRKRGLAGSARFLKLTDAQVADIVNSEGKCQDKADEHGVHRAYVAALRRNGGRASSIAPTASVFAWRPA